MCSGVRPTSGGSPAIRTSSTGRSRTIRRASSTKGPPTGRTRIGCGRSSRSTRPRSSTRPRRRSAHSCGGAWGWYWEFIGGERCPVVDTWWQTETGMILITPLPGITALKPGSATFPFPGVSADVFDDQGNSVPPGGGGYLVLTHPWPAMLRTIWGDPDRDVAQYYSRYGDKVYLAGDGARLA